MSPKIDSKRSTGHNNRVHWLPSGALQVERRSAGRETGSGELEPTNQRARPIVNGGVWKGSCYANQRTDWKPKFFLRRYAKPATPKKPISIMIHVDGSGIAG